MTPIEKERITVRRVHTEDMLQFPQMPYHFDCEVKHFDAPNGHPFAFIELDARNRTVAKQALVAVSDLLIASTALSMRIPKGMSVPVHDLVFSHRTQGYTRLICTPHTFTGRISKYPLSLLFTTDPTNRSRVTHGQLFYGKSGEVEKAEVFCWRGKIGCFFYLSSINGELSITKVETTNGSGIVKSVYIRST